MAKCGHTGCPVGVNGHGWRAIYTRHKTKKKERERKRKRVSG